MGTRAGAGRGGACAPAVIRAPRRWLLALVLAVAGAGPLSAQTLAALDSAVRRHPELDERRLGGCVVVHHLWKREIRALARTAGAAPEERLAALVQDVYLPDSAFWAGYVGDEGAFIDWARKRFDLEDDPRRGLPLLVDPGPLIEETTRRVRDLTGLAGCATWTILYGPGWTDAGGLGRLGMVVDYFGPPRQPDPEHLRLILPHELQHVVYAAAHSTDRDAGTLLQRMVDEGFASYLAVVYWRGQLSPAAAVGYTSDEWAWALAHERELWLVAAPRLHSRERRDVEPFRRADTRVFPGGPTKVGYFLGYRIVEEYVRRHGRDSWRNLYHLPLARILEESGFDPGARRPAT